MKRRTSPVGDDHDKGKNRDKLNMQNHKPKADKENAINMVGQSSNVVRDKCNNPSCVGNLFKHVATQIRKLKDDSMQFKLELKRIANMKPNLMNRTSHSNDQDHDKGKKKIEDLPMQNQMQKEEDSKCYCGICFDFKAESDMFGRANCDHPFCIDCISKHVAAKVQQNILKVNCPNPSCDVELTPRNLMSILPKDVIDRWESAKCESSIVLSQKVYCPFKKCCVLLVNDGNKRSALTKNSCTCKCSYCHWVFCVHGKVAWHVEMNWKEFQKTKKRKDENDFDKKFLELAKVNKWPKCPNCSFYVQRRGGCAFMTCRCGCHFCYKCGKEWIYDHICKE